MDWTLKAQAARDALRYVFMHRVDDPQIVVEEIFWQ